MTITFANFTKSSFGSKWHMSGSAGLGIYATGGYPVTAPNLGMARLENFVIDGLPGGLGSLYNVTTQKLMIYEAPAGGGGGNTGNTSGGTPTGNNSVPIFTGAALPAFSQTFSLPSATQQQISVFYSAAPGGNPVFLNRTQNEWYLESNLAIGTTDYALAMSGNGALLITYAAVPTGFPIYMQVPGAQTNAYVNNSLCFRDVFTRILAGDGGLVFDIRHDLNAAIDGTALYFNEVMGRFESAFVGMANQQWNTDRSWMNVSGMGSTNMSSPGTPAGLVSAPLFAGDLLPVHLHSVAGGGGAASPLVEVANGVDLTGVTGVIFEAIGV